MLAFAHIGDLHINSPREQNAVDLLAIAAQIEMECRGFLDFVVLPGDNADNGRPDQYRFIATALRILSLPIYAITGDHDMEGGDLTPFRSTLSNAHLPRSLSINGARAMFLDMSGPGAGGPDFRLGAEQMNWLEKQLEEARSRKEPSVLFMHTYPDDLKGDGEAQKLTDLIAHHDVALVDMGHTHYNELGNDGHTIYAATRSTGQIEEGPVGYSLATVANGIVSWRFKALDEPFPFVMITSPADRRLLRDESQIVDDCCAVEALVFGSNAVTHVEASIDEGDWLPMQPDPQRRLWRVEAPAPQREHFSLTVRAFDETGRPGLHRIEPAGRGSQMLPHRPLGADSVSIGAWPENGIYGTQLGPNRNAKPINVSKNVS